MHNPHPLQSDFTGANV